MFRWLTCRAGEARQKSRSAYPEYQSAENSKHLPYSDQDYKGAQPKKMCILLNFAIVMVSLDFFIAEPDPTVTAVRKYAVKCPLINKAVYCQKFFSIPRFTLSIQGLFPSFQWPKTPPYPPLPTLTLQNPLSKTRSVTMAFLNSKILKPRPLHVK